MNDTEQLVRVTVDALALGGSAVGTIHEGPERSVGKRCFVRFAAPGDEVTGSILEEKKNFALVRLEQIEQPSTERVEPPCRHFGTCGGCDLQHLSIEGQRTHKRRMLETMLHRHGGLPDSISVDDASGTLPAFGVRGRTILHVVNGEIGYFAAETHEVVPILECPILEPELFDAFVKLKQSLAPVLRQVSRIMLEKTDFGVAAVVAGEASIRSTVAAISKTRTLEVSFAKSGGAEHRKPARGKVLAEPLGHFSQVNRFANEQLIRLVKKLTPQGPVTEFYSGAGNFSIPLAQEGRAVVAVELDAELVRLGGDMARSSGVEEKVRFVRADCADFIHESDVHSLVVLDPPRTGAAELVRELVLRDVTSVVYVSCNPSTLARDLKILHDGGFETSEVHFVDMFPQTGHVESVVKLSRPKGCAGTVSAV